MPKCYRFKATYEDEKYDEVNEVTFRCKLKQKQCISITNRRERCRNTAIVGIPYCHTHIRSGFQLRVVQEGEGRVYAHDPKAGANPIYRGDDDICIVKGEVLNTRQVNQRYGDYLTVKPPYLFQTHVDRFLDLSCDRNFAGMIRHARNYREANCMVFVARGPVMGVGRTLYLAATRNIYHGDELMLAPGRLFFLPRGRHPHKTYPCK